MTTPSISAEEWLLKAIQSEVAGSFDLAIASYSKAYKMKPELEFRKETHLTVNGIEYDEFGAPVGERKTLTIPAIHPKKFKVGDKESLEYLDENGYVVFESVADPDQTKKAVSLFWDHIEAISNQKIIRNDPTTWNNKQWPSDFATGIFFDDGLGQSDFMWYCRGIPKVKEAFSTIWKDDDLLVSFDGCGAFRPPEFDREWLTRGGWYHVDQNGNKKKGRHAVQGLLNLFPSGETDGGLVVFPKSIKHFDLLFKEYAGKCSGDYYEISKGSEFWQVLEKDGITAQKLCVAPGDLVLWDSRAIHCNTPPTTFPTCDPKTVTLRRLVAYICMTPTSMCNDVNILKKRIEAYRTGLSTNHWPHEFWLVSYTPRKPAKITEHQKGMISGLKYLDLWDEAPTHYFGK